MRIALSLTLALTLPLLSLPAAAGLIAEESFRPSFPIYANGGRGFATAWTQGGFNALASRYVPRDRSLCYR
ncbi:MAG TPA: hypothetical protein VFB93_17760 [Burkholderiales bacterium]|nr:hypothetical protein [Burkholderiales bacterium]